MTTIAFVVSLCVASFALGVVCASFVRYLWREER